MPSTLHPISCCLLKLGYCALLSALWFVWNLPRQKQPYRIATSPHHLRNSNQAQQKKNSNYLHNKSFHFHFLKPEAWRQKAWPTAAEIRGVCFIHTSKSRTKWLLVLIMTRPTSLWSLWSLPHSHQRAAVSMDILSCMGDWEVNIRLSWAL